MTTTPLPREIAPGIFWLGKCVEIPFQGQILHSYNSVFLVVGEDASVTIEAGYPEEVEEVDGFIEAFLAQGVPEVKYCFVTHTETPHAGGVGRYLQRFPNATAIGDVSDLHLVFPEYKDRIRAANPGESFDLGGRRLSIVQAVFRDHINSRWAFDENTRTLFAGDGFSYAHYHAVDQCGKLAEEVEIPDLPDMVAFYAGAAFNWTTHTDIEPYIKRLNSLVFDELRVNLIAPTHGLPIGDPTVTMPSIEEGLRIGSSRVDVEVF